MIYESKFISLISKDKILMLITIAPCPEKKNHHIWYEYSLHNYFPLEGNMIHLKINFNFLN